MPSKDLEANGSEASRETGKRAASKPAGLKAYGSLFGSSDVMLQLYEQIERVAQTEATALIVGESGTGKELIARTIHDRSARHDGPFIAVNCGAIPDSLIEAELFGHEKGSFTGAAQARGGYFEHASGGTLFLDEVTEMSPVRQVKLLRALETGKFFRVGGTDEIVSNARVIAATNRDPNMAVKDNLLREDLMYRLAVFPLRAPPLRERGSDRELLAQHFLDELNADNNAAKTFSKGALDTLRSYNWPGNVREMKNAVYRAFILAEDIVDLPNPNVAQRAKRAPVNGDAVNVWVGTPLAEAQRQIILATLKHCGGDKKRTAKALGVSLKTLYNRLGTYETEESGAPQ
ncbi:sigma-54 interaction domain-containing protein [Chitinasiproducens palmae]|uniref:DNA-binding transcriptional response regulator, NtrC family, contains REC, AAA-type ATPase, and a Fis-type DNA-binding domains n=1 Tax=Chitinasiproducens palmae TaxID=1770053 RepID=A0A1H2PMJ2_9BURK|nr:sigma-54 dependent transcriptional regulator [Chitinasiproducens palmae]SDV47724.1 DNA-binding transcriptional response regulator, NtrC family, contains REC, AAA-type ATPase, and a Fis-type DNA-binding domains [Chitinasiproducens palmae]